MPSEITPECELRRKSPETAYDFSSCEFQIVADVALYSTANTYTATFPCSYPNIEMGSEIHPHHLDAHQSAIIVIKNVLSHAMSNKTIKYLL